MEVACNPECSILTISVALWRTAKYNRRMAGVSIFEYYVCFGVAKVYANMGNVS